MAFVAIPAPRPIEESEPAASEPAAPTGRAPFRPRRGGDGPGAPDVPVGGRSRPRLAAGHVVLALLAGACAFPVYWMFATALRAPEDALSQSLLPWPLSLENLRYVWDTISISSMMRNTFVMSAAMAVAQLFVAILAAYGFATWRFRGQKVLFLLFVGSWLVPFQVTMIPNYVLLSQLGLLQTVAGVIVPNLASAFAVLMMRQHMAAFPRDLLDASSMDGRSSWRTLWTVVVPNMRPALAALGILLFISAWNEYLWPALVLQNTDAVLQVGIRSFMGAEGNNWGAVMAASGLATLPVLLIYVVLQRHVVDSFVRSGLK